MSKHPHQNIVNDGGILRFQENKIVRSLLDTRKLTMNDIALLSFPVEDRIQFAQLIGYSIYGFLDLSYSESVKEEIEELKSNFIKGKKNV